MANTETTSSAAFGWRPDVSVFQPADVVRESLYLTCTNVSGRIEGDEVAMHVAYCDDDDATVVAEAAEVPESDPALSEVVVYSSKISQLIRLSAELYSQVGTADQLAQSVSRALVKKSDSLLVSQAAPTPPANAPSTGLLATAGIVNGGAVSGDLDGLVDLVAELQANGSNPTHVLLGVDAWAELRKLKVGSAYNQSLLGAGTVDSPVMLLSLPVVVNREIPALTGMVIDRSAVVSAVGPVSVATDMSVYFTSNSVALLALWRVGHNVVRPDRIGKFTVAATGS